MSLAEESLTTPSPSQPSPSRNRVAASSSSFSSSVSATNVGSGERLISTAAGALLALQGFARRDLAGLLITGVGAALAYRGSSGHCQLYETLGINTNQSDSRGSRPKHGIHLTQTFSVGRSPEDLYDFWRNFENLPRIMTHLKSVQVHDDGRSHWVATAPAIVGGEIAWDAEITADEPNRRIAWQSLPGSFVDNRGSVAFEPGRGDRGTTVRVEMEYAPPGGRLGKWVAALFGESPEQQIREDLRTFKRVMEVGEAPTIEGQPRGSCVGRSPR